MFWAKVQPLRFRILAAASFGAGLYHLAALVSPAFARIASVPWYPVWRHLVFIAINFGVAFLMLRRPRWFLWVYLILTVQVLQGHGVRLWRTWFGLHEIQWVDVAVVGFVLVGCGLLYLDRGGLVVGRGSAKVTDRSVH